MSSGPDKLGIKMVANPKVMPSWTRTVFLTTTARIWGRATRSADFDGPLLLRGDVGVFSPFSLKQFKEKLPIDLVFGLFGY